MQKSRDIADLLSIMARLRDKETGCPWDIRQDFSTIAPYTIEEAYEVAEAIARGNARDLCEELGDLLLQVVFHARMAEEEGLFSFADVVEAITDKLIRRHPHVFGDSSARTMESVHAQWSQIKAEEKAASRTLPDGEISSLLDSVPGGLPPLLRAKKLQDAAAKVGFDWNDAGAVLSKLQEEIGELETEIAADAAFPRLLDEFGDVLFALANLARHLKLDPEIALGIANEKFRRRFSYIEKSLRARGLTPNDASLAQMEELWNEAKENKSL